MMNAELLRISDVATRASVSIDTVRYYERKGLLRDVMRDPNGQRRFRSDTVDRINVIRCAAAIGFTLDELVRIFARRASGHAPCGHVLESAKRKLIDLDQRIAELQALRSTLESVIGSWERKFDETPAGSLAYLLESLVRKEES
jgi:MerR family transcriptional regulator, Zn(II)-responsive regulator of zntA